MVHRLMRTEGLVADMFGTDRPRVNNNQQVPYFLEIVGPSIVICGPDLPQFMEVD